MNGNKLKIIIKDLGFSLKEVADLMGESPQNLNSMLNAQDIKTGVVERISVAIKKNLYSFMYNDIKLMSYDEMDTFDKSRKLVSDEQPASYKVNTGGIPLIPLGAMAGYAKGETQILEHECERYVVPVFREAEFLITVKGSSMIPKYNSGDIVACKHLPLNDLFFQWNKVYVLDTAQGALIKRVCKGRDENHVTLVSDNVRYDPFELHRDKLNAVALVIGVIRLE